MAQKRIVKCVLYMGHSLCRLGKIYSYTVVRIRVKCAHQKEGAGLNLCLSKKGRDFLGRYGGDIVILITEGGESR